MYITQNVQLRPSLRYNNIHHKLLFLKISNKHLLDSCHVFLLPNVFLSSSLSEFLQTNVPLKYFYFRLQTFLSLETDVCVTMTDSSSHAGLS